MFEWKIKFSHIPMKELVTV